jgi:hypothetical protein
MLGLVGYSTRKSYNNLCGGSRRHLTGKHRICEGHCLVKELLLLRGHHSLGKSEADWKAALPAGGLAKV